MLNANAIGSYRVRVRHDARLRSLSHRSAQLRQVQTRPDARDAYPGLEPETELT